MLLLPLALAQQFRFPTTVEDAEHWYPTAYVDHEGVDWACGDIRYGGHTGSDFGGGSWSGMNAGRDVVAAAVGVVASTHDGSADNCTSGDCPGGGGYGNHVRLLHPDGRETVYAHMKKDSVSVEAGDRVDCGQPLGQMGSSGYSTGPHLHFEVRTPENTRRDPFEGECSPVDSAWLDQGEHDGLPGLTCDDWPACEAVTQLSCGDSFTGSTDMVGASDVQRFHGCTTWREYTGPEVALALRLHTYSEVDVQVTGLTGDVDLYVLDDLACDAGACIEASSNAEVQDEHASFVHAAGDVVLILDGWREAVSPFTVTVTCSSAEVPDTGLHTGDTRDTQASIDTAADSTPGGDTPAGPRGCGSVPLAPSVLWLTALWALRPTRRVRKSL